MNSYIRALKILELELHNDYKNNKKFYTFEDIRKKYKSMALQYHPDKNINEDTTEKFQKIQDAYQYLLEYYDYDSEEDFDKDYGCEKDEDANKGSYIWYLYSFLGDIFHGDKSNKITCQIIEKILTSCEENALEALNKLEKHTLIKTVDFIKKYEKVLHINKSFLLKIEKIILEKTANDEYIKLTPTLDDLFSNNLYKLTKNGSVYVVPLWHNELIYDNSGCDIYIQCEPTLPDNIEIDENNNIIANINMRLNDIWGLNKFSINIGNKPFEIEANRLRLCDNQTFVLYRKGISRINTVNIYDISMKSDVIINLKLYI